MVKFVIIPDCILQPLVVIVLLQHLHKQHFEWEMVEVLIMPWSDARKIHTTSKWMFSILLLLSDLLAQRSPHNLVNEVCDFVESNSRSQLIFSEQEIHPLTMDSQGECLMT